LARPCAPAERAQRLRQAPYAWHPPVALLLAGQIEASNPTVTYKHHNDDELVQTNQLAATFYDRYQTVPQPVTFATDAAGDRVVVFECTAPYAAGALSAFPIRSQPNIENGSRVDGRFAKCTGLCMNSGSSQVVSNIISEGNGSKTVTFECRAT